MENFIMDTYMFNCILMAFCMHFRSTIWNISLWVHICLVNLRIVIWENQSNCQRNASCIVKWYYTAFCAVQVAFGRHIHSQAVLWWVAFSLHALQLLQCTQVGHARNTFCLSCEKKKKQAASLIYWL